MLNVFICFLLANLTLFTLGGAMILGQWAIMRIWDVSEFTGQIWRAWEFIEKLFLTLGFLFILPTIVTGILTLLEALV